MKLRALTLAVAAVACGGGALHPLGDAGNPLVAPFLPLAVGNTWTYACGDWPLRHLSDAKFVITDSVLSTATVNGQLTYAYALTIPTSATASRVEVQLLANDADGNTRLWGYLNAGIVVPVAPALIVVQSPQVGATFNYPAQDGGVVSRVFKSVTSTNPTGLGTYPSVDVYFETGGNNYGYQVAVGIVERDHLWDSPATLDCVITAVTLH